MPSAKDITKRRKVILAYGPTGGGKTTQFLTLPGKKFSYAFDPSTLDTIAGQDIDYQPFFVEFDISIGHTQKGATDPARRGKKPTEPRMYMDFQDHIENWLDGKPDEEGRKLSDYDVLGFNSVTTLQYGILQRILHINNKTGQVPELSDYMICGDTLLRMLGTVIGNFPGIVFIEAHDDLVQDKITHKIVNQLDLYKNLRRELPRMLTDLLIMLPNTTIDGTKYEMQAISSKDYPACKNSMNLAYKQDVTINFRQDLTTQGLGRMIK